MRVTDRSFPFRKADVVLLVPPFAAVFQANLACHLLQACARRRGFDVAVVYGNLAFAATIGKQVYSRILEERLQLEHIFRRHAFETGSAGADVFRNKPQLKLAAEAAEAWLNEMAAIFEAMAPKVVGATCCFEQISSSVAALNGCKLVDPGIITIIGGANCEGEMAEGILSLGGGIDHVASGESEESFPAFLNAALVEHSAAPRIIYGKPCTNLASLPTPDYREYFEQYSFYLPEEEHSERAPALPYESSRGCWWGEKHHCTFCGLNGSTMTFREKPADQVLAEVQALFFTYPVKRINVTDNIMPYRFFRTLLPRLAQSLPEDVTVFYEQKANLALAKTKSLKDARITAIQPGIESLNSNILRCMDKGVSAPQNIAVLRYTRCLGIDTTWNLLAGFPGDQVEDYAEIARVLPYLAHLQPPDGLGFLRIDRFSPYFNNPEKYGIANLRPKPIYFEVFPAHTDVEKLAYYFDGDYRCGAFHCRELLEDIAQKVESWRKRWLLNPKPILSLVHLFGDEFVLTDTRGVAGSPEFLMLNGQQAEVVIAGADLEQKHRVHWAIERNLLIEMDGRLVPLATAPPALFAELESRAAKTGAALPVL